MDEAYLKIVPPRAVVEKFLPLLSVRPPADILSPRLT